MQPNKHRTWAEIDLGAIEHNYRVICEAAKAPVLCVVKADCYGHGAVPVANRLQSMGAPYFAVATVPEAVELRENGIEKPIIILGYIDAADMDTVAEYGITAPVYDEETAELLSAAAVRTGRDITVHYKLDTGMPAGLHVLDCYSVTRPVREMVNLRAQLEMEYDNGVPEGACERIREFFTQEEIFVEKRTKHKGMTELNIAPLIRSLTLTEREGVILADAVVAAQDPGLNPALIGAAVARHLPEIAPDFVRVRRKEVYDAEMNVFR